MLKTILRILLFIVLICVLAIILGPRVTYDQVRNEPITSSFELGKLNAYINGKELKFSKIKPENESRIIWYDTLAQSEYALVYIHGFSAGPMEADPVVFNIADKYGFNLYIPRLPGHGLADEDAFLKVTPEDWVDAVLEAVAIGKTIGKKVILMSTSTGSTLSIYAAAGDPTIHALLMLSPNISLYDPNARFITGPWGEQILRQLEGDFFNTRSDAWYNKYWYPKYRVEGLIALQSLLDQTMKPEIFKQLNMPIFCGVFYKDEQVQDEVVSVPAIFEFAEQVEASNSEFNLVKFDDATNHVLAHENMNRGWLSVQDSIFHFIENDLLIAPDLMSSESRSN